LIPILYHLRTHLKPHQSSSSETTPHPPVWCDRAQVQDTGLVLLQEVGKASALCPSIVTHQTQLLRGDVISSSPPLTAHSVHEGFSLTQTSWITLLSTTHYYEFPNIHKRAINEIYHVLLQHDHPILISVGKKYNVEPQYMVPSLIMLMMRVQPLTLDKVVRFLPHTMS